MADEADLADDRIESAMAEGLFQNSRRMRPESHPDFNGEDCVVCNLPIPKPRLAMGKVRCTHCQNVLELKQKLAA